jgi:hypothetical protein
MDEVKTPINSKLILRVAPDKRTASASVTAPQNEGIALTVEDIMAGLNEGGVVFGIQEHNVHILAKSDDYGKQEVVAMAQLPVKGEDASLKLHFEAERELRPRELADGSVDFKDLGIVCNTKAGDLLVTKTPAGEGTPGVNVLGEPMPASSGKDVKLPVGPGTVISEDELHLLAEIDGQANIVRKRVTVSNLLNIEKDVGVGTGNIDFVGNVKVKGNVSIGFKVKATGSVTINGILDGGTVEAGGNVSIDNGFNGMEKGEIISGGDVRCKYFQNGKVTAKGSIYTGAVIGSTVSSGDKLHVSGNKSKVYNSFLSARNTIACVNVGTEGTSRAVTLEVGSDPGLMARKAANPKETQEAQKSLHKIEQLYAVLSEREKRGSLPADKVKDYEKVKAAREQVKASLEALAAEKEEIEESIESLGFGSVVISGSIKEGTIIVIGTERYVLPSNDKFVRFRRDKEQGIVSGPAK